MTDRVNQHFVPQFYFRHFSDDDRTIGVLLVRNGKTIPNASIKGQCARRNFYGSKKLETIFSEMEAEHCRSIRAAVEIAWDATVEFFSPIELIRLFEAIVFQRGRTALEIEKHAPVMEKFALKSFKHYLLSRDDIEDREEMIRQIDVGSVRIKESPQATIARQVGIASETTLLITDMRLLLLRNRTDFPFIFSDAPVVFYNNYCQNVKKRGVLGLQCQGLQIFFPLNPWTCLLLMDEQLYDGPFRGFMQYDLHQRSDISQINALQLHHALNSVYFGSPRFEPYVSELWTAHRTTITRPTGECRVGVDLLVDGKRPDGELMQLLENQINFKLALSFIDFDPVSEQDYVSKPRTPNLRDEYRGRVKAKIGT